MNLLTEVRQAAWQVLKASLPLVEFMEGGRWYTLESGSALPGKVSKDDCPALIITPGELPTGWEDKSFQCLDYALNFSGFVFGEVTKAEEFFMLVYEALMEAYPNLGVDEVKRFRIVGLKFQPYYEEGVASYWEMCFDIVLALAPGA